MMTNALLIMFSCTMVNHLGLIEAVEKIIGRRIPIANCCKCFTFWVSLIYLFFNVPTVEAFAIAFALAFASVWFELLLGLIDKLYDKIYCKAYGCGTAQESSRPEDTPGTASRLPEL